MTVRTCIVHLLRRSLADASYKERRVLAAALKTIYRAPTRAAAEEALDSFEAGPWGEKYPAIVRSWRSAWEQVAPFFAFSQPIRSGGLHDQRDREPEQHGASGGASPRALPQQPRGDEADLLGGARGGAKMAGAAALLAPGASGVRDLLWRPVRGGAIVTGGRDFHRLPTGAWATHGPAPVDRPWKSLRAPARRRIPAGANKLRAASAHRAATVTKYGRSNWIRPPRPKHGISDTPG